MLYKYLFKGKEKAPVKSSKPKKKHTEDEKPQKKVVKNGKVR